MDNGVTTIRIDCNGSEVVDFDRCWRNFKVDNFTDNTIYFSTVSEITDPTNELYDVVAVPSGGSGVNGQTPATKSVYLYATGEVQITASNNIGSFKIGGGVGSSKKDSDLPDGYTAVAGLRSTGTQYIDTGVNPVLTKDDSGIIKFTGIELTGLITHYSNNISSTGVYCLGVADVASGSAVETNGINIYQNQTNFGFRGVYSDKLAVFSANSEVSTIKYAPYEQYRQYIGIYKDGIRSTYIAPTVELNQAFPIYLFGLNVVDQSPLLNSGLVICNCKLFEYEWNTTSNSWEETILRDFNTVLDDNSVPSMYDKVTKQTYYTPTGTGSFLYIK